MKMTDVPVKTNKLTILHRLQRRVANRTGGAVAQSLERATPGEEVPRSIPVVAARSLLVGSVSV